MQVIEQVRVVLRWLLEVGLMLLAIGILLGVVVGTDVPYLGSNVVVNLNQFLNGLGNNAVPTLLAFIILIWLYSKDDSMLRGKDRGRSRARRKSS